MYDIYQQHLLGLHATGKYRELPAANRATPAIDFSTNDYLGLSANSQLLAKAIEAAKEFGIGATGSRLLSGNRSLFENFEAQIAHDKNTAAALIFNSGFQTNISTLSSLLQANLYPETPLVFFDKLNHASLYQGVLLSGAELIRYHHNNLDHLADLLKKHAESTRQKFIITETLFGMDGDECQLHDIMALAKQHHTFLYLDEAHATGIYGEHGYGLSTTVNLHDIPHVIMGSFSKALGCSGGYIACHAILKDYFINKAAGFIYSTANSPLVIGAAYHAWQMIKDMQQTREHLAQLSLILRNEITKLGFSIGNSHSHIVPIILGKEQAALNAQKRLKQHHIIASCIRPPTVPPGTSRLRIALTARHQMSDIQHLLDALRTL